MLANFDGASETNG